MNNSSCATSHRPHHKYWVASWLATALICLGLFIGQLHSGFAVVSDISYLLPHAPNPVAAEITAKQNESFRRRYILLISTDSQTLTQSVYDELIGRAPQMGFEPSASQSLPQDYLALLQQTPYAFAAAANLNAIHTQNTDYLIQSALNFWLSFNAASVLPPSSDPLGLAGAFVKNLTQRSGQTEGVLTQIKVQQQAQTTWQQIVPLATSGENNSLQAQQNTFADLQNLIAQVQQQYPGAHIYPTGLAVHAVHSAVRTQNEILLISAFATLAIIILSLCVYRSLLPLCAALGTIAFGSWVGAVSCVLMFNHIHILAIAFGTSLMGVVVDYSFHYFSVQRHFSAAEHNNRFVIRLILPGISLSIITALAGYLGLWQTGMAVLQQIALLCVVGILAACLTIIALYPRLPHLARPHRHLRIERLLTGVATMWQRVPTAVIYGLLAAILGFSSFALYSRPINQSLNALYAPPQQLRATEQKIAQVYKEWVPNQYLAVIAPNPDALIQQLYALAPVLNNLVAQGLIQSFNDLTQWVPDPAKLPAMARDYAQLINTPEIQAHFAQFDAVPNSPSQTTALPSSGQWINHLPDAVKNSLYLSLNDTRVVGLVRFSGISDAVALQTALNTLIPTASADTILNIDTVQTISQGLQIQTRRALLGLALAFGLSFAVLMAFYRSGIAAALIAVPLASCAVTLCFIMFTGNLTLFHLLALFLALGLGVDYAILFSHSKKFPSGVSAEIVSLAAIGNALSFGLLSFTSLPMLAAFGLATSLCLICNFIFAPLVVRWVRTP